MSAEAGGSAVLQHAQDTLDGRALRLLREALPEGCVYELCSVLPDSFEGERGNRFAMDVERDDDGHEIGPLFDDLFYAPTIAEAADAARLALSRP